MMKRNLAVAAGATFLLTSAAFVHPTHAGARDARPTVAAPTPLRKFNVTVRRFDPAKGMSSGEDFVLPVDSPDEEHAISATLSNAVAFTTKSRGSEVLPIAFVCMGIRERP